MEQRAAANSNAASSPADSTPPSELLQGLADDAIRHLLSSLLPPASTTPDDVPTVSPPRSPVPSRPPSPDRIRWNLVEEAQVPALMPSAQEQGVAAVARALLDWLESASATSEDAAEERSQAGTSDNDEHQDPNDESQGESMNSHFIPSVPLMLIDGDAHADPPEPPHKRARHSRCDEDSRMWFPWHDRIVSPTMTMPMESRILISAALTDMHSRRADASSPGCLFATAARSLPLAPTCE